MQVNKLRRIAEVLSDSPSGEIRPVSGRDDPRFEKRSFDRPVSVTLPFVRRWLLPSPKGGHGDGPT
jgi:hypothetical protein